MKYTYVQKNQIVQMIQLMQLSESRPPWCPQLRKNLQQDH